MLPRNRVAMVLQWQVSIEIARRDACAAWQVGPFCLRYSANCMYTNLHHFIELAALDFQRNQFWLIEAIKLYDLRLFSFNYDFSPRNLFNIMQFCSSNNNKYRAHIRISFYKTKNKIFFNVIPFWSPTIHYTYTKRIPLILYISFSLFLFFADFIFCLFCILRGISGMHCCRRERNHKEDFLVLQIVLPLID